MTPAERHQRILAVLQQNTDLLAELAHHVWDLDLEDEDRQDLAERICIQAFGQRVECPDCGSLVFPGVVCWGCENWLAPESEGMVSAGRPACCDLHRRFACEDCEWYG